MSPAKTKDTRTMKKYSSRWKRGALTLTAFAVAGLIESTAIAGDMPTAVNSHESVSGSAGASGGASGGVTVDEQSGSVHSTVTFELPPARGAAQPKLAIAYSSGGGRGTAGWGWSLGLPSIERHPLSNAPRFEDPAPGQVLDANKVDRFVFGGAPLVSVCTIKEGGACTLQNASPITSNDNAFVHGDAPPDFTRSGGWHYFRLENEGPFMRFFLSPDFKTWVIQTKAGVTMELGVPLDGSGSDEGIDYATFALTPAKPFRWNIVRQYDVHRGPKGFPVNRVVYRWRALEPGNHLARPGYLTDVYDTPAASDADSNRNDPWIFEHHTHLEYEATSWPLRTTRATPVWKATPLYRLRRVDVTSSPWNAITPRRMVRRYKLDYFEEDHRSYLEHVELEGNCGGGTQAPAENADGFLDETSCKKQPRLTFSYARHVPFWEPKVFTGTVPDKAFIADINGDGIADFVGPNEEQQAEFQYVALNSVGAATDILSRMTIEAKLYAGMYGPIANAKTFGTSQIENFGFGVGAGSTSFGNFAGISQPHAAWLSAWGPVSGPGWEVGNERVGRFSHAARGGYVQGAAIAAWSRSPLEVGQGFVSQHPGRRQGVLRLRSRPRHRLVHRAVHDDAEAAARRGRRW